MMMAGTLEAISRCAADDALLQRIVVGVQVEDHDIAVAGGDEVVHSVRVRFEQDPEFFPQG